MNASDLITRLITLANDNGDLAVVDELGQRVREVSYRCDGSADPVLVIYFDDHPDDSSS